MTAQEGGGTGVSISIWEGVGFGIAVLKGLKVRAEE
jgi:hypothetical protein